MKRKTISIPSILFSVVMLLLGAVVVLLTSGMSSAAGELWQRIGLAFIVTGVVVLFQESVVARFKADDSDERFGNLHSRIETLGTKIDASFRDFDESYGTKALAIRLISLQRAGYDNYHHWLVHMMPESLFFAGHSVLHRVQIDMDRRGLGSLEDSLLKKVSGGSRIRILFLDPRWEFISRIAEGENQAPEKMMADLAITLGICRRLWTKLDEPGSQSLSGTVEIRICQEIQQYAYHSSTNLETGKTDMMIGLYFAKKLGMHSPLFAVEHREVQEILSAHFGNIFDRATKLLEYTPPIRRFDHDLYRSCRDALSQTVDQSVLAQHCPQ
jgi:hypothetical protein